LRGYLDRAYILGSRVLIHAAATRHESDSIARRHDGRGDPGVTAPQQGAFSLVPVIEGIS
jgi:hypothetical protein